MYFLLSNFSKAVPYRIAWRRPLMVRQPYSVAVPSTRGRLHPLVPEVSVPQNGGNEGGVKTIEERLGEKGGAFFNGKEGRDDFRKKIDDFRNQNPFSIRKDYQSPSTPHVLYPFPKD